jgi:prefoldin subunit 5
MAFVYKFTALLRCYERELLPLQAETFELNEQLAQLGQQMHDIEQQVTALTQHINVHWHHPELHRMQRAFIREQQEKHQNVATKSKAKEDRLQDIHQEIMAVRTKIRQLEKHRQRLEKTHAYQQQKQQLHEADDIWLRLSSKQEQKYGY